VFSNLKTERVVSRRPVSSGNWPFIQSQICAELSTVMYQVIEEHLPVCQEARSFEDGLALKAELPALAIIPRSS
jgi:hypothetical protein